MTDTFKLDISNKDVEKLASNVRKTFIAAGVRKELFNL